MPIQKEVTTTTTVDVYAVKCTSHIEIHKQNDDNIVFEVMYDYRDQTGDVIEQLGTSKSERLMHFNGYPQEVKDAILTLRAYGDVIAGEDEGLS